MMGNRKLICMLLVGLSFSGIVLSGCTQQKANTIIVGTSSDYPPFEVKAANGTIIGFDIDLITKILVDQGYKVEVRDVLWESLVPELQQGKIDVIAAAMSIKPERMTEVSFSNPYYDANQAALIRNGSGVNITTIRDITKYIVGAQTGTTGWNWVNDTLITTYNMSADNLMSFESALDAVQALAPSGGGPGHIDVLIIDSPVATYLTQHYAIRMALPPIQTNESYGFAVKIGNTALLNHINAGLANVTGSTYWNDLINKYFAS